MSEHLVERGLVWIRRVQWSLAKEVSKTLLCWSKFRARVELILGFYTYEPDTESGIHFLKVKLTSIVESEAIVTPPR